MAMHDLPSPASGRGAGGEGKSNPLLDRAKQLRQHQTDAEAKLWYHLRGKRHMGLKFKRQKPIGPYIVDFVCFQPALVVEVDGSQHAEHAAYDQRRNDFLRARGFTVLRFWNNQVLGQIESVLEVIAKFALSPDPSPARGRGEMMENTDGDA
jgi:very-short-patch-repair endonuclease